MPTPPSPQEIIRSWSDCAVAYDSFVKRWPVFIEMADGLLNHLASDFRGTVLDIGGGSGLITGRLLNEFPDAAVIIVEPAQAMRALARQKFGDRVAIHAATSDELGDLGITADAALCNASFHLMDEHTTLPSVASVLAPGAPFVANLWGHSFDETADNNKKHDWHVFVNQALEEFNLPPLPRPQQPNPRLRTAESLRHTGRLCGLELVDVRIESRNITTRFNIEFAIMRGTLLDDIEPALRDKIFDRALKLCQSTDKIAWVTLRFQRV